MLEPGAGELDELHGLIAIIMIMIMKYLIYQLLLFLLLLLHIIIIIIITTTTTTTTTIITRCLLLDLAGHGGRHEARGELPVPELQAKVVEEVHGLR